jgi:hypothetical protein
MVLRIRVGPIGPFFGTLSMLLQMLGQVRLLRVALAAELANVRLEVLALLVLWYVVEKRGFVGEALVAGVAFVGLVRLVAPRVRLQVRQLAEGLRAARVSTFVGLVAGVGANVLLQVRQLGELALAYLTAVGLDAQVDAGVLAKVAGIGKGLCTLRTFVGLRLAHMQLVVHLKVALVGEYLQKRRRKNIRLVDVNDKQFWQIHI